ncbi:hypothetical protein SIO70_28675 [Chitinophaga sancti]|uniref:hypothetical protein n=1 Tax=Chitinophaga sancti TaxID=1004 RepID=UPI002A7521E1|nr:hypothetical protein [Chitinophaga sancti]WPQ62339.1 hypothetical protein SIO70_28675 [Chitinophaga sancti]
MPNTTTAVIATEVPTVEITYKGVSLIDPVPLVVPDIVEADGEASESYSIEVSGLGQLTGLSYTIPAHTSGYLKAQLMISALSSQDVKDLNELAMGMLNASYKEEIREEEKTSVSADLSMFSYFFGGGASASYERTRQTMKSKGLSDAQITLLMEAFLERASKMSTVSLDFYINNSANDYAVSGDLYLYTLSGTIKTEKGTQQYRMLANQAAAGGPPPTGGGAPSSGNVIKL